MTIVTTEKKPELGSKNMKNRYELAYMKLFEALPTYRKHTVKTDKDHRWTVEFAKDVQALAESEDPILLTA